MASFVLFLRNWNCAVSITRANGSTYGTLWRRLWLLLVGSSVVPFLPVGVLVLGFDLLEHPIAVTGAIDSPRTVGNHNNRLECCENKDNPVVFGWFLHTQAG